MKKFNLLTALFAALLVSGNLWAQKTCKIGTQEYASVAAAIAAVPTNDVPTTIQMIADEDSILADMSQASNYANISKAQNIILDLNGHSLTVTATSHAFAHQVIDNAGTLTIMDSQDPNALGEAGKIEYYNNFTGAAANVTSDLIINRGTLNVKSGYLNHRGKKSQFTYVIDNMSASSNAYCTIEGGKFQNVYNIFRQSQASTTYDNVVNVLGGKFLTPNYSIFNVTDGSAGNKLTLNVAGGDFDTQGRAMIYCNSTAGLTTTNSLKNTTITISGGICTGEVIQMDHDVFDFESDAKGILQPIYDNIFNITGGTFVDDGYKITCWGHCDYNPSTGNYEYDDDPNAQVVSTLPTIIDGSYYRPESTENPNVPTEIIIGHVENKVPTTAGDINNEDEAYTLTTGNYDISSTTAEAYNITVKDDVVLTVKDGAVLTIGDGGLKIEDGGKVIVEAGGVLEVGVNGIFGEGENALEVYSDETGSGVVKISPMAFLHQSPELKVVMRTRGYTTATGSKYQFFAVPTKDAADLHWPTELTTWFFEFDPTAGESGDWSFMNSTEDMEPFKGYIMTNDASTPYEEYTMEGAVNGRDNAVMVLEGSSTRAENWNLLGNSYLAPMDAETLLKGIKVASEAEGIELSLAIYDAGVYDKQQYLQASLATLEEDEADFTVIPPMNAFFVNLKNMNEAGFTVDYNKCVWEQEVNTQAMYAPARKVAKAHNIKINVAANGMNDRVLLRESNEFTSAFDNGYEATKFMNEGMNLYVNTTSPMAEFATNDLNGTTLAFEAGSESKYTLTLNNGLNEGLVLVDNENGNRITMIDGATYNFSAEPNSVNVNRFQIVRGMPTNLQNINNASVVKGIYTIMGQFVAETEMWDAIPAGVYVVDGIKMVK